jgi:hypothetical protein
MRLPLLLAWPVTAAAVLDCSAWPLEGQLDCRGAKSMILIPECRQVRELLAPPVAAIAVSTQLLLLLLLLLIFMK